MKRTAFLWVCLSLCSILTLAQAQTEICNDGIDNDGDGFIDCFDGNCAANSLCDGTFLGNDALCQAQPVEFPKFTMTLDFASPNETTNHLARMAIGDLDRDGIPEIITMNRYTKKIFILDGRNGSIKHQTTTTHTPQWEIAIANIDNDNCAEIFTFGTQSGNTFLMAYNCDLTTQLWKTQIPGDPINFGLADFNGDGKVELYAKDAIFDAKTGVRLVNSQDWSDHNGGPVAVDIRGDADLELVIGGYIYDVDLGNGTADNGSLTELMKIPDYHIKFEYNATSVADYNLDGFLDVLASGSTVDKGENTTIFFWDVQNNTVKTFFDNTAGSYQPTGWKFGTGRINIADLDGDGQMNASYVSGKFLYALDEDLNLFWRKVINEETSGHTGCTLFDFNGDGKSEIVYRDELYLYIINGTDGTVYNQQACVSRTNREYPIVADVDADGSTEMCVPCGFDDDEALDEFDDLTYSQYSHVRVFKSAAEPWVPARRLWNQHGYFNVNVNDDLTIPRRQQKHHLVWSTGSCTTGPNRPLNGFLNQSPYLNSQGCPTYASPDLAHVQNSLVVNPPTCPGTTFTVSFKITNLGDVQLDGVVPITFYNGNPNLAGATKLNTINITLTNFAPGQIFDINNATVNGPGSPFTLYIALNDAGTTVPTPIKLPNTNFVECDYGNNVISSPVTPLPVKLTALKVSDNSKCIGSTTPDNGAARAFVLTGAVENTTDYNFFWFNGTTVDATPDFTGAAYSGIPEGQYRVFARHKTVSCSSDTVTVTIGRVTGPLVVNVTLLSPVTDCKNPNGSLKATAVSAGQPPSAFTFAWYQGNDIFTSPQIGVADVATGLRGLTYTVLVTEKISGCQTVTSFTVPDQTSKPVPTTAKTDIVCSSANSGEVRATVNGSTSGHKFEWFKGPSVKPAPDFTTATVSNLPAGDYTLLVTHNASKCISNPVTVTVAQTTAPVVTAAKASDMTSCDPLQPNGSATASVPGGPAGFSFEWFRGANTLAANKVGSAATLNNVDANIYRVKVTETATGCFGTADVTIGFNVVTPTMSSVVTPVTTCNPYNGNIAVTPSVDTPAEYTFSWYNGPVVKATTDFPTTTNVLGNLPPGQYTVSAVNNVRHCNVAPITVTVLDNSPSITITLNSSIVQLPSDCSSADGIMGVNIASPGNTLGFRAEWFAGRSPFANPAIQVQTGVTASSASGLSTGIYTVVATDLNSGCSKTDEFYLPFADAHEIAFVSKDDVETCVPGNDGSATVKLIPSPDDPPVFFDEADYDIFVYNGRNDPGASGAAINQLTGIAAQADYTTTVPLTPGFYTFVAVSKAAETLNCRSFPLLVEIERDAIYPVLAVDALNANSNCVGAPAGNGSITVSADGGNPANYTFEWFAGTSTNGTPVAGTGVNGEQLTGLFSGFYTVRITNNSAFSQGCTSTTLVAIGNNPMVVDIDPAGMALTGLTTCDVTTGMPLSTGAANVTAISENGAAGNLANYNFAWTDAAGTSLQSGASPSLINRAAGNYFVQATNNISFCSAQLAFTILDNTIGTTTVVLDEFENAERCIAPKTGRLEVRETSGASPTYTYEWYAGPTPSGTVVGNLPELTGIAVPSGQTQTLRTVKVVNGTNNCWAVETYIVPLVINEVQATVSASPLTSCIAPDGSVFGTVTNDNSLEYTYSWSIGTTPKATPDFTGKQVNNLVAGNYTMVATDIGDPFCESPAQTVMVIDSRVFPPVTTMILSPVTNCDPTKANGGAEATVNGDITLYNFDWFAGTTVTGVPFLTGASAGGLSAGPYTVRATDRISGCSNTAPATITLQLTPVPNPDVTVLSNVTSCVLDNGAVSAAVNGNTSDYIFNWYIGSTPKAVIDYTGEVVDSLAVGTYTVVATSRITGCISGPDSGNIVVERTFPDFEFKIVPASCESDNGYASLVMMSNVPIERIEWLAGNEIVEGPNLSDVGAGTYTVRVVSQLGCETTKDVIIGTEIRPFNGVSRNGDGRNDIFQISCIENFPANLVKIFNRAGTLVYMGEGYDNVEIYFDGKSNKGVSPMGVDLPDGTYYYVIDKRDGSKPLAGYLELVK